MGSGFVRLALTLCHPGPKLLPPLHIRRIDIVKRRKQVGQLILGTTVSAVGPNIRVGWTSDPVLELGDLGLVPTFDAGKLPARDSRPSTYLTESLTESFPLLLNRIGHCA